MSDMKKILVTGAAGFIGSHTVEALLELGHQVTGIDNFDPYYPRHNKEKNIEIALSNPNFNFHELDILDKNLVNLIMGDFDIIIHLAAKAGVRNSIENPDAYFETNVNGTLNLLEFARIKEIPKFIFSSSSSVYGINDEIPWSEEINELRPISPYASSKIAAEVVGNTYAEIYNIQFIGLRLFTVFGPRQRPDLAIHKFIARMLNDETIDLYGDGSTSRDYTFVKDIVQGIIQAMSYEESDSEIFNLGSQHPYQLLELIEGIEKVTGIKANVNHIEMQEGDVPKTYANIEKAKSILGYKVNTDLEEGIRAFLDWKEGDNE
jgi:UDP-glucuronate 4-epimerase